MWKSQGERSGLYGGCWSFSQPNLWSLSLTRLTVWGRALLCKRMIPSDSIPGRFEFMACRSQQETDHTTLLFFACLYFQCWTNTLYTTLTSRAIKKQLCAPVRFHYACLLPHSWQYWYITTMLSAFARNVFYGRFLFSFDCSLYISAENESNLWMAVACGTTAVTMLAHWIRRQWSLCLWSSKRSGPEGVLHKRYQPRREFPNL